MSFAKNVALVGASGAVGSVVFQKLVADGSFNLTVLRRNGSSSTLPAGSATVVDVDFESLDSLTAALKGQDAVVSTIGSTSIAQQKTLVDAAIAAGVTRILPSEFGSNLDVPATRKLPVFGHKVELQDYIIQKAETSGITYSFVYSSAFLDWGLQYDFILKVSDYRPTIIDGGESVFSTTTLASVATAVVGILKHLEETKNRAVYIEDVKVSQNKLLEIAKSIAPEKPWQVQNAKLDDITAKADARLAQGLFDSETFVPYLYRSILDPAYGGNFPKVDNELLGLKGLTEEEVTEVVKQYVK